jgi:type I restriction enzyme, S subunit
VGVKPGYKQTEVGIIPEDWEVAQLGEIALYTNGKAHENSINEFGKYIVVNSKFISTSGEVKKYSNECFLPANIGEILMVMSDVPNGRAIAKCFFIDRNNTYTVNQRICVIRQIQINERLLYYKLDRNQYYLTFDDGVKQTNLRKNDILSCPISFPSSRDEQEAIAEALSDADAWIEQLEQLIAKKRQVKQGAMQELLTGKKRLEGFRDEWEERTFGEIFDFHPTATNARNDLTENGDTYYIHYGDIHTKFHNHLNFQNQKPPKINRYKCKNASLIQNGDWIMVDASEDFDGVGKCIEILGLQEGEQSVSGLHTFLLREKRPTFALSFKGHLGGMEALHDQMLRVMTGMKVFGVSKTALKNLTLSIPPLEEQSAIASILSDMDAEIAGLEGKLEKARQVKRGMMHNLLTGKIRLV